MGKTEDSEQQEAEKEVSGYRLFFITLLLALCAVIVLFGIHEYREHAPLFPVKLCELYDGIIFSSGNPLAQMCGR